MANPYSYEQALQLMGEEDPDWLETIDKATGGAIIAGSVLGGPAFLALLGVKDELVAITKRVLRKRSAQEKVLGQARRIQLLEATHGLLAIAAGFQAVDQKLQELGAIPASWLKTDASGQAGSTSTDSSESARAVFDSPLVTPRPDLEREQWRNEILEFQQAFGEKLYRLIKSFSTWDSLDETKKDYFATYIARDHATVALRIQESHIVALSTNVPEFAIWQMSNDIAATQATIHREAADITSHLQSLNAALITLTASIGSQAGSHEMARRLHRAYVRQLERPLLGEDVVWPYESAVPSVRRLDIYITPRFRVLPAATANNISSESAWRAASARSDFSAFLLSALTTPSLFRAPLMVLGQPGSGKSLLTQVLAAQIPASGYAVIRVPLRNVRADAALRQQIEESIASILHEDLSWKDWRRSIGTDIPVVILDGFDELIQATGGRNTTNYLTDISEFQQDEFADDAPVIFIVTTRTLVADRARIPNETLAVKLEPFNDAEIETWVDLWNAHLPETYRALGRRPLVARSVKRQGDLAAQPVLLLMLALYDLDGGGLQDDVPLLQTELLEKLIHRFVVREVQRHGTEEEQSDLVAQEERRLEAIAVGMQNRAVQFTTDNQVDEDFRGILGHIIDPKDRGNASPAQRQLRRFFFVVDTKARQSTTAASGGDDDVLRSYEFLHATFAEYLTARSILLELQDNIEQDAFTAGRRSTTIFEPAGLRRALEHRPLLDSSRMLELLKEIQDQSRSDDMSSVSSFLLKQMNATLSAQTIPDTGYNPNRLDALTRTAVYTLNLTVLHVLIVGPLPTHAIAKNAGGWRGLTGLWSARLPDRSWDDLNRQYRVTRNVGGDGFVLDRAGRFIEIDLEDASAIEAEYGSGHRILAPTTDSPSVWLEQSGSFISHGVNRLNTLWQEQVMLEGAGPPAPLRHLFALGRHFAEPFEDSLGRMELSASEGSASTERVLNDPDAISLAEILAEVHKPIDSTAPTSISRRYQLLSIALDIYAGIMHDDRRRADLRTTVVHLLRYVDRDSEFLGAALTLRLLELLPKAARERTRNIATDELAVVANTLFTIFSLAGKQGSEALSLMHDVIQHTTLEPKDDSEQRLERFLAMHAVTTRFREAVDWASLVEPPLNLMLPLEANQEEDWQSAHVDQLIDVARTFRMRSWVNTYGRVIAGGLHDEVWGQVKRTNMLYIVLIESHVSNEDNFIGARMRSLFSSEELDRMAQLVPARLAPEGRLSTEIGWEEILQPNSRGLALDALEQIRGL